MRKYFLLLFIYLCSFTLSDIQKERIVLNWQTSEKAMEGVLLTFENAHFNDDQPEIPIYTKIFVNNEDNKEVLYSVSNRVFEKVNRPVSFYSTLKEDIQIEFEKYQSGENEMVHLNIIPFKKVGDEVFRLKSFDLKQTSVITQNEQGHLLTWKNQSVLSSGKWIKIQIQEKGIYKIPFSLLNEWGFTDPLKVNIFGSGGIDLSENPGELLFDDLIRNTVWTGKNKGEDCLFFYAQGIVKWEFNENEERYEHTLNPYSKYGYYFLTDDAGAIKNVDPLPEVMEQATQEVTSFDSYFMHEKEWSNVLPHGSGRKWYGETFRGGTGKEISLEFKDLDVSGNVTVKVNAIGRSYMSSEMKILAGQKDVAVLSFQEVNTSSETSLFADEKEASFSFQPQEGKNELQLNYNANSSDINATAWLDYVEVNYRRKLRYGDEPLFFRDSHSVGEGNIVQYSIQNNSEETRVFDISDSYNIKEVVLQHTGTVSKFKQTAEVLREYVVFNPGGDFPLPEFAGEIENQNLHGINSPEFIIISHPDFMDAANDLADFHRSYDGMNVEVVSAEKVYNEFSSGTKSPTGLRNFFKMLYDKGNTLKYVLLFGDGSFDNRNIRSVNKNFIPTYQSENSLRPTSSFVSDDYFVILDENESVYNGAVDLGIGRIPAASVYEAELAVEKIKNYYSADTFGDWKNRVCFIADDEDGNLHMSDSEKLANSINLSHKEFVTDKIYFDSYQEESTPAGETYPDVTDAINERVKDGVLVLNYVGHANNRFMADERVLDISDVNTWSNENKLPIFVTATCEFSRFDADETSIGEYVLFNPNGGGIGLFSTTRVVFAYSNFLLSRNFYEYVFAKDENGKRYRMGDIMRLAKVNTINTINKRNFSLLGDPALMLSYPANKVITTVVNGEDALTEPDTIGALQTISIEGFVADFSNEKMDDFNGKIIVTVYDKEMEMKTLGNGGETPMSFMVRENIIYKGMASVSNGNFSFSFVVPKDIAYNLGNGKIIYYATDSLREASGAFENFLIGSTSDVGIVDNKGPEIQLYLDSPEFKNGDQTSKSPELIANLSDENGINTVGSGIGHDITAVLDNDYSQAMVLNDYYEASIDDYTSGTVRFQFKNLSVGKHSLKLKAWDVANNSSEVEIEFEVSGNFNITKVTNYPNPVSDYTYFIFEHNQPGEVLKTIIEIFDQTGKRIDLISTEVGSNGRVSNPVRWDLENTNAPFKNGIYIYRILVQNSDNIMTSKSGKMIISR